MEPQCRSFDKHGVTNYAMRNPPQQHLCRRVSRVAHPVRGMRRYLTHVSRGRGALTGDMRTTERLLFACHVTTPA